MQILRGKFIAYCDDLPFAILSPCYLNIETMNIIISSDTEIHINQEHIVNITKELSTTPKEILLPHFFTMC